MTPDTFTPTQLSEAELRIASALHDMAIGRGGELDDTQVPIYLRGLSDLDPALVERACDAIAREQRAEYAPVVPAIGDIRHRVGTIMRADRDAAAARQVHALPPVRSDREPTFYCLNCHDEPSGWRPFWCPGRGSQRTFDRREDDTASMAECARGQEHGPHPYVARCECRDTNPVIARHRERMAASRRKRQGAA